MMKNFLVANKNCEKASFLKQFVLCLCVMGLLIGSWNYLANKHGDKLLLVGGFCWGFLFFLFLNYVGLF